MARPDLRHPGNVAGQWYVDERCIDCGTCRDLAQTTFSDIGPQSVVSLQPDDEAAEQGAWLAAQACPTLSIGRLDGGRGPGPLYPWLLTHGVYDLGDASTRQLRLLGLPGRRRRDRWRPASRQSPVRPGPRPGRRGRRRDRPRPAHPPGRRGRRRSMG